MRPERKEFDDSHHSGSSPVRPEVQPLPAAAVFTGPVADGEGPAAEANDPARAPSPGHPVPGDPQRDSGGEVRPDFVIVGAQKSASTFLHYCLSQHPDVFVSPGEVCIFEDPDFSDYHPGFFQELFRGRTERCLGIRRPNYLGRPEVPGRIAEILPDAKLIAVLRNPIDRAISAAFHQMTASFIPVMDIDACMQGLLEGDLQRRYPRSRQILEFGKYYECFSRYENFFERKLMFVVTQERFLQNKELVLRDVFRFVGVDDTFVPGDLSSKKQPGHYHPLTQRLARLANNISHYRDAEHLRARPRGPVARFIGRGVKEAANIMQVKVLKETHPRISERCRAELYAYYREDIENLERFTGWDCSAWKPGRGEARRPVVEDAGRGSAGGQARDQEPRMFQE